MKTNEEFRASVYARAEREKQRLAVRQQKTRSACLSVAMLLVVAAIAVPLARNLRGPADIITEPSSALMEQHTINPAALGTRMVLLVGTQVVVLENEAQQKDFVNQYKIAKNLGDSEGIPVPAVDTAKAIHSADELAAFLAELPEADESMMRGDYNEAFFEGNDLYVMPMELAAQPEGTAARETTTTIPETDAAQGTTPAVIIPDATIPDAVAPSNEDIMPTQAETSSEEQATEGLTGLPEGGLLQNAVVRVLLLVPVNKG